MWGDSTTEAIILAGGRGQRLRPLTDDRPKPMVQLSGQPLLEYTINWLKNFGIKKIIISCGYRRSVISDYFGDGSFMGVEVAYSEEDEPLGRGGGIKRASKLLSTRTTPVIVANGDVITCLPLDDLFTQHRHSKTPVTIVTTPMRCPYGIVDIDENNLAMGFREKPVLPYWINAGIYVIDSGMFDQFPDQGDHEETLFPTLASKGMLKAYKFNGFWTSIDTCKDLEELKKEQDVLRQLRDARYATAS